MAEFSGQPQISLTVTIVLTEDEARALSVLPTYGIDTFIKHFYSHLGKGYLVPHEKGLRSLLESANRIGQWLDRTDRAREAFNEPLASKDGG